MRLPSADGSGIGGHKGSATNQELAEQFGVSSSTLDILDQGTPEQIQSLRDKGETGEGPGVRTVYEQVQQDKLKSKLQTDSKSPSLARDNLRLKYVEHYCMWVAGWLQIAEYHQDNGTIQCS
jgi:hypothetical protein